MDMFPTRTLTPWLGILISALGAILMSSFLAPVISPRIPINRNETEAPDVTLPASISIENMPLVTKDPEQPEWYLYSSAEPTRDEDVVGENMDRL